MTELSIHHPTAAVRLRLPAGLQPGMAQPVTVLDGYPVAQRPIVSDGDVAGTITVQPVNLSQLPTSVTRHVRYLPKDAEVVSSAAASNAGAPVDLTSFQFAHRGTRHHGCAAWKQIDQQLTLTAVVWGTDTSASSLPRIARELLFGASCTSQAAPVWASKLVRLTLALNLAEAILSVVGRVPVYGPAGAQAAWPLAVPVIALLGACWVGVKRNQAWGYLSATMITALLGVSGALCLLLASSPGFYVPALERGGIHALLWVVNTLFNLAVATTLSIRHWQVFQHLD